MSKQKTEPTGEPFSTSPELGFAFGRIKINKIIGFLRAIESRTDESYFLEGGLLNIENYFEKGPELVLWKAYLDADRQRKDTNDDSWLSEDIRRKYGEIADMLYIDHLAYVDEEKFSINNFLTRYPRLISKDEDGSVQLVALNAIHHDPTPTEIFYDVSPIETIAVWSDATEEKIKPHTGVFVDMTALPEVYSQQLNRYRISHAVDLNT